MELKIAIATVFHNGNLPYFKDYFLGLKNQTKKDFTLLAFNDGVENLSNKISPFKLTHRIIDVSGSPSQIRGEMIRYLYHSDFDIVVFIDSDDYPSTNRIEDALYHLRNYNITCCDLIPITESGDVLSNSTWGNRGDLINEFSKKNITTYNIVGLGNTAIKKKILKLIDVPKDLKVADWYIFYEIIENELVKFSADSKIYYRQHANNLVGLKSIDSKKLFRILEVKKQHYKELQKKHPELKSKLQEIINLEMTLNQRGDLDDVLHFLSNIDEPMFWWEETDFLKKYLDENSIK